MVKYKRRQTSLAEGDTGAMPSIVVPVGRRVEHGEGGGRDGLKFEGTGPVLDRS